MKTFRTTRGPFKQRPHFEDSEVEATCLDELRKVGLLPDHPSAIRIDRFVEKRFKVSVEPADLDEGILGLTKFGSSGVQGIYVSRTLDEDTSKPAQRRVRSTIGHEAGHGLLHAYLFALNAGTPLFGDVSDPAAPKVLCREDAFESERKPTYSGEWWEFQANMAMGHLLMPRPLVVQAVTPYLVPVGSLGVMAISPTLFDQAVRHLSETFDVNPILAKIRMEALYAVKNDKQLAL